LLLWCRMKDRRKVCEGGRGMINKNSQESAKLTGRQRRAIPLVLAARNVEEGCRAAGITTTTWYTWMTRNATFKADVDRQREAVISEALDRLKAAVNQAVEGLTSLMNAEEKHIRLRACEKVVDYFFKNREIQDIEERLTRLEKLVTENGNHGEFHQKTSRDARKGY